MFKFLKQKNKNIACPLHSRRGFTLVETLVAIAIFTMSVVAMMVILGDSLSHLTYAKRKLTATYLAQEGVEYMRNLRDTYVLYLEPNETTINAWDSFKANVKDKCASMGCTFDIHQLHFDVDEQPIIDVDLERCILPGDFPCPYLYYNPDTGEYNHDESFGNINSGFRRRIRVLFDDAQNPDEIKVVSTVYWIQGSGTYDISFSESLFNWTQ